MRVLLAIGFVLLLAGCAASQAGPERWEARPVTMTLD